MALGLAASYVTVAGIISGPSAVAPVLILLLPALALIWFADELSEFTGFVGNGRQIDRSSPAFIIAGFGWTALIGFPLFVHYFR